jgi:hypothetical protein
VARRFANLGLHSLLNPGSEISGRATRAKPVPLHTEQTPVPEQSLHFGSLSFKCGLIPVPSHCAHCLFP